MWPHIYFIIIIIYIIIIIMRKNNKYNLSKVQYHGTHVVYN